MALKFLMDGDVIESKIDQWPLMGSPFPMLTIFALYLILTWAGYVYMRNKQPKTLSFAMQCYNLLQVILCSWLVWANFDGLRVMLYWSVDEYVRPYLKEDHLTSGLWWYIIAKILDLTDTFFIIMRKKDKQISYLHLYHHSSMLIYTWGYLNYFHGDYIVAWFFVNSFVHVMMYSYFFLAAFGPEVRKYLWWKKYLTRLQIIQFIMPLIYLFVHYFVRGVKYSPEFLYVTFFVISKFLVLFLWFYVKNYSHSKSN